MSTLVVDANVALAHSRRISIFHAVYLELAPMHGATLAILDAGFAGAASATEVSVVE